MSVYLAARFSRRDELEAYANQLIALGVQVASRWHKEQASEPIDGAMANHTPAPKPPLGPLRVMPDLELEKLQRYDCGRNGYMFETHRGRFVLHSAALGRETALVDQLEYAIKCIRYCRGNHVDAQTIIRHMTRTPRIIVPLPPNTISLLTPLLAGKGTK